MVGVALPVLVDGGSSSGGRGSCGFRGFSWVLSDFDGGSSFVAARRRWQLVRGFSWVSWVLSDFVGFVGPLLFVGSHLLRLRVSPVSWVIFYSSLFR